jgi:drug/metabolite transporter (DMT)-like permease
MMTVRQDTPLFSSRNLIVAGIGLSVLGIFLFAVNDAIGKWILATFGLGQFLLIRSLAGLLILAPVIWRAGLAPFRQVTQPGLQFIRAGMGGVESAMFFLAVIFLPLADVTTFYLAAPIFVAIMAVMFLGERVGWRRWAAIFVGFGGVIIALGPSSGMATLPALIALVGSFFFALLIIITRHLRATPDVVLVTYQFVATAILGLVISPFGWAPMTFKGIALTGLLGALALGAHYSINRSLKLAPASVVSPFHYTIIVWAVIFGFFFFGDVPKPAVVGGAALVIASGLVIFFRERSRSPEKQPDIAEH